MHDSAELPTMNPLDEAAKESSAHTGPISSARDDYALASPLQVVVDTQDGTLPLSVLVAAMPATRCTWLSVL